MNCSLNIKRQKWVDHKFNLGIDPGWSYNIVTRISDIGLRCRHHCGQLTDALLSTRVNEAWSIKEHIGHLIDLEELHINRLKQFEELEDDLIGADMSNRKTEETDHNAEKLADLIARLSDERERLIFQFYKLNTESLNHFALHPRLRVKMRPVDLLYFIGEHDDHHLTSIIHLREALGNQASG